MIDEELISQWNKDSLSDKCRSLINVKVQSVTQDNRNNTMKVLLLDGNKDTIPKFNQ